MNFHHRKEDFVPVSSPVLEGHYRVALFIEGDEYRLVVGLGKSRFYTEETLPPEVKTALGILKAFPPVQGSSDQMNVIDAYINRQDPELDTVGWCVFYPYMYMVVLSAHVLNREAVNGTNS